MLSAIPSTPTIQLFADPPSGSFLGSVSVGWRLNLTWSHSRSSVLLLFFFSLPDVDELWVTFVLQVERWGVPVCVRVCFFAWFGAGFLGRLAAVLAECWTPSFGSGFVIPSRLMCTAYVIPSWHYVTSRLNALNQPTVTSEICAAD